jgi:hypothetical protein
MKNCVHVWKSRNLTYTGKTLIVKNLLISLCGYEIEMRGIPEKYVKEITTLFFINLGLLFLADPIYIPFVFS